MLDEVQDLREQLRIEQSIAEGAVSLLGQGGLVGAGDGQDELRKQVQAELEASRQRIKAIESELERTAVFYTSPEAGVELLRGEEETEATIIERMIKALPECDEAFEHVKRADEIVLRLRRSPDVVHDLDMGSIADPLLDCLADARQSAARACSWRILRHTVAVDSDLLLLKQRHLQMYMIRSLARDDQAIVEKDQVISFMRRMWTTLDCEAPFDPPVVRALVSVAEASDERLRMLAIETLAELLLIDPQLVKRSGGYRVLLHLLVEGPHDLAPHVISSWQSLFDLPSSRQYFRTINDLTPIVSGITDTVILHSSPLEERANASANAAAQLLMSWPGLMMLSAPSEVFVRSIIKAVESPSYTVKRVVVKLLTRLFAPVRHSDDAHHPQGLSVGQLRDKYLAILLVVFLDAGLMKALTTLALTVHDSGSRYKVAELMGSIQQLTESILPLSYAPQVQALPELFAMVTSFDTSDDRLASSHALSAVENLDFNRRIDRDRKAARLEQRPSAPSDLAISGARKISTVRRQVGMQIDEAAFRDLLLETRVLETRDHASWSMSAIFALFEGPLLVPKRLDEAMHASKFMRRLMAFFSPFDLRFSALPKSQDNEVYLELACTLVKTLLGSAEGIQYMQEDKLIGQLVEAFAQIDPIYDLLKHDVLFSRSRMRNTMCSGYFDVLAILAADEAGNRLLSQNKLWSAFLRALDRTDREDIQDLFLDKFSFAKDGLPRVALTKLLSSSSTPARFAATQRLAYLLSSSSEPNGQHEAWQIRLMINQLYDPSLEVCRLSVETLERVCDTSETLEMVVKMRPSLDHLGQVGASLLTRFLSTTVGVDYLDEIGFLQRELEDWYTERTFEYVLQVEGMLEDLIQPLREAEEPSPDKLIPHFYGELVKTDRGCSLLAESGHLSEFTDFLEDHAMEADDRDVLFKLKAVLWALGHVGSSPKGLLFLEEDDVINIIVAIAEESPVFTIRGTAYYALCLVASTIEGAEVLDELGWECAVSPLGAAKGVCVPKSLSQFVQITPWSVPEEPHEPALRKPSHRLDREVILAISNLSNHILATKASRKLTSLKAKHKELFSSPFLLYRALDLLGRYHFRQATRRFILDLFDVSLDHDLCGRLAKAAQTLRQADTIEQGGNEEDNADTPQRPLPFGKRVRLDDGSDGSDSDASSAQSASSSPSEDGEGSHDAVRVLEPAVRVHGFITR